MPVTDRSHAPNGFSAIELLVVVAITAVIGALALPVTNTTINNIRLSGDASSVSNAVAVTKMRAASAFSQVRLYVDLAANSHHLETWRRTGTPTWVTEGGTTLLAGRDRFSSSTITTPPPNTQTTIGQAPACRNAAGTTIANTACIVFNSRGIPVDATGAPLATDAIYVTDGTAVYGVTVSATGLIRLWRTFPKAGATWSLL